MLNIDISKNGEDETLLDKKEHYNPNMTGYILVSFLLVLFIYMMTAELLDMLKYDKRLIFNNTNIITSYRFDYIR